MKDTFSKLHSNFSELPSSSDSQEQITTINKL